MVLLDHARALPNLAMVAAAAEEVDGGSHGIASPPATVVADMPPQPPPDSEFFRALEAIASSPEWRRSRLRNLLRHGIFALGLLVISFALPLLANALGHWATPALLGAVAILCPWPYWFRRHHRLASAVLCGLLTTLGIWVTWWAMPPW
jgi:hypothetical protein